jgi:hypothetical protein
VLIVFGATACGGSDDESAAAEQTVTFQEPEDPGPDPFTGPADIEGDATVPVSSSADSGDSGGSQPFGGSGSNRVCDRDKLIRFLRANPERMREWARVLGVSPTFAAVKKYIAKLHPVTLTRDTQVTNHAFRNGRAVPFQAILKAGTAVLVDKYGVPVVRCYCGNPLKPAVFTKTATCKGCPANYKPPRQCEYGRFDDYDEVFYRRRYYSNRGYDEVFISRHRRSRYSGCYEAYPDPPVVTIVDLFEKPEPAPAPVAEPAPAPEPTAEPECDVAAWRANQCADLTDKSTDPGVQTAPPAPAEPAPQEVDCHNQPSDPAELTPWLEVCAPGDSQQP